MRWTGCPDSHLGIPLQGLKGGQRLPGEALMRDPATGAATGGILCVATVCDV